MSIKKFYKSKLNRDFAFFKQDEIRDSLVKEGKLIKLKKTYNNSMDEKNLNTGRFCDEYIDVKDSFKHQGPMTKDRLNSAVKFIGLKSGKLLDIGLGHGFFEMLLIKENSSLQLHGIDISSKAISKIKKSSKGIFKKGTLLKIPFPKDTFDIVVALEVIEHIPANNTFLAYKEIKRVLKNGGQFIVSIPVHENYTSSFNPNRHMRSYTPRLFLAELKLANFKVEKFKKFYAFTKCYKFKNFLRHIFRNKWKPNVILAKCTLNIE